MSRKNVLMLVILILQMACLIALFITKNDYWLIGSAGGIVPMLIVSTSVSNNW